MSQPRPLASAAPSAAFSPPSFPAQGLSVVPGIQPPNPATFNPRHEGIPGSQPAGFYLGTKKPLQWAEGETFYWAETGTTVLDLRAEYGGGFSNRPSAEPIRPFQGAHAYIQIEGWQAASATERLYAFSSEWGSIHSSEDVAQMTAWEDVTTDAYGGRNIDDIAGGKINFGLSLPTRAILVWEPPPTRMRFWQVKMRFIWAPGDDPPPSGITVISAMY